MPTAPRCAAPERQHPGQADDGDGDHQHTDPRDQRVDDDALLGVEVVERAGGASGDVTTITTTAN